MCAWGILLASSLIMPLTAVIEPRTEGPILSQPSGLSNMVIRLLQMVAMGCAVLALALGAGGRRHIHWRRAQLVFGALLLWTFARVLADVHAGVHHTSLFMAILVIIGYYFTVHSCGTGTTAVMTSLRVYTVASSLLAIFWPTQVFCVLPGDDRSLFGLTRLCGVTGQPNTLGEVAGIALIIELSNVAPHRRTPRIVFGGFALASLLLSQSRTAWMACVLALVLMLLWRMGRTTPGRAPLFGLGILSALGLVVVLAPHLLSSLSSAGGADSSLTTVNGRAAIWAAAMAEFHRDPMFGYGLNLYDAEFTAQHLPFGLQMVRDSHSQFVQTLGESGLVGFAGLILFILACGVTAWMRWREDTPLPVAVLVFMLFRCFTESGLMFDGVGWQLWCVLLLSSMAMVPIPGDEPPGHHRFSHLPRWRWPRRAQPEKEIGVRGLVAPDDA